MLYLQTVFLKRNKYFEVSYFRIHTNTKIVWTNMK